MRSCAGSRKYDDQEEIGVLLVDLDKCIGCHACEVGCQQWHNAPRDKKRIRVHTIGPHKKGDNLMTVYFPEATNFCDFCASNQDRSLFCVDICPVDALHYCDEKAALSLLSSGKRYQMCKV
jgi:Fe-S-cluster-containing dehydrogenase component